MASAAQLTLDDDYRNQLTEYGLHHDPTTGLPNHTFFRNSFRDLLDDAVSDGQEITLLWVDVLNLRREYSMGGTEGVDRLICAVSDSLREWVYSGELICRFSGRCFLLALKCDEHTPARLRLILDAASHLQVRGSEGMPDIAAGMALFPTQAVHPEELIRFASLAALSAARSRARSAVLFEPGMNSELLQERALEKDLRAALRENQLSLEYQPQIDLMTGNVIGAEGLSRWNHPTRGIVSPTQFIPIAEHSHLIDEIFAFSLRQMLIDAASWRAAGFTLPSISVNASPANIRQEDFVAVVARELEAHPLGATRLEIEVTESLLMDDEDMFLRRLNGLRSIGVKVSLDDFGTRYTGFNALKGLPLSAMKIDKCFVHGVNQSSQAQSLCRTIVTMARHLHLSTVAEGIEDVDELHILKQIGCQVGQGFLFQRPSSSDEFLRFLAEWPERRKQPEFSHAFPDADSRQDVDPLMGVA